MQMTCNNHSICETVSKAKKILLDVELCDFQITGQNRKAGVLTDQSSVSVLSTGHQIVGEQLVNFSKCLLILQIYEGTSRYHLRI